MSHKLLITGANGFIGSWLADYLEKSDEFKHLNVIRVVRQSVSVVNSNKNYLSLGDINQQSNWSSSLKDVDTIVHLAARVHVMKENSSDPLADFRKTNRDATLNLAQQAIKAGVRRFIYLSSIKVNGEKTLEQAFKADDRANPVDAYAVSKYEAETALLALHQQDQIEVVIIRPPLVYGPGVKGNFARLIGLLKKHLPLPLAGINNKRSLVSIDNLCSFISCCIVHKKAVGQVFLVSDGEDISTTQLLNELSYAMQCKSNLFKLPAWLFKSMASGVGKKAEYQRLADSLQVDIKKNQQLLNWVPKLSLKQAFKQYFALP